MGGSYESTFAGTSGHVICSGRRAAPGQPIPRTTGASDVDFAFNAEIGPQRLPKCECASVGGDDADTRRDAALEAVKVATAAGDSAGASRAAGMAEHWTAKGRDIKEAQVDYIMGHVNAHKFLTAVLDLTKALSVQLKSTETSIDVNGVRASYDPSKSYPLRSTCSVLVLHADAAAARPGRESSLSCVLEHPL